MSRWMVGVRGWSTALAVLPVALACSSSEGNDSAAGGSVGTGGSVASGGSAPSGGQASGTGGSATGGVPSTGGVAMSGGTSTGGNVSTPTGGTSTGGAGVGGASAGATAGGATFQGGSGGESKGGAPSGGAGGSVGGGGGAGEAAGNGGASAGAGGGKSAGTPGCGSANPLKSGTFNEMVDGTSRKYVVDVPSGYDASKPHRLIFVWHPLMGSADQVVSGGYNGLKSVSNGGAILVAPEGMNGSNAEASGNGWWNVNDRDMKFLTAMLERLEAGLCIDRDRIFSTGFSFGGMMSYAVGYEFDVFRAIAPCSGDMQVIPHEETHTEPLPIMAFHGNNDTFVTTARGRAARDKYLARNGCGTQTEPVAPSPCVQYQGCSVTTIWCEFPGGHNTWSEQPQAIWKFFSEF